jgi:hypothetical protein
MRGDVVLTIPPWRKVRAGLRDISVGGISVFADHLELPVNTIVTLAFSLKNGGQVSHHRLPGQVVYCDERRIGLVFVNPANETLHALRDLADVNGGSAPRFAAEQSPRQT